MKLKTLSFFELIQILTFYNAVANNGVMVKPQFVKEIRLGDQVKQVFDPELINSQIWAVAACFKPNAVI